MKKLILLATILVSTLGIAQEKITEGKIISKQTMSSPDAQMNMQLAMVGEMITTTYFKEGKSRAELKSPMAGNTTSILNMGTKEMLVIMDNPMVGKKYILQKIDNSEEKLKDVSVEETKETKEFLGYNCKKYIVKMKVQGVDANVVIYATDQLPSMGKSAAQMGNKIKGFPLFSETKVMQAGKEIIVKAEVTEIKKEAVSDDKFDMTPPAGYEKQEVSAGM
ncbi:hypothetical protein [Pseudofulvibacter geojedonensis]|uniref:DUF4412 domain-containing protein n=1 Tax=Pseudofulvibacter geojedonensis TaxID=1123758 RepID=A0ABW3I5F1_9FLAO